MRVLGSRFFTQPFRLKLFFCDGRYQAISMNVFYVGCSEKEQALTLKRSMFRTNDWLSVGRRKEKELS